MSTKQVRHFPINDNSNGWSRILAPRTPQPALAGKRRADWVVVGAGYAGLAAARRLAENQPSAEIVLIEAGEAGENASGRNSGLAIDNVIQPTLGARFIAHRLEEFQWIDNTPAGVGIHPNVLFVLGCNLVGIAIPFQPSILEKGGFLDEG